MIISCSVTNRQVAPVLREPFETEQSAAQAAPCRRPTTAHASPRPERPASYPFEAPLSKSS